MKSKMREKYNEYQKERKNLYAFWQKSSFAYGILSLLFLLAFISFLIFH